MTTPSEVQRTPAPVAPAAAAPAAYTWSTGAWRAALAPLAGAALALSFPAPGLWPLALPALAVLFALWTTAAPRRALAEGFVGGGVFFGLMLRWFAAVLIVFSSLGSFLAFAAVVLSGVIMGTLTAVVAWTIARLAARFGRGPALALAPVLWIAFEVSRATFPFPFPWGTLAAAWARAPGGPAIATVAGSHGLSLVLALGSALGAAWLISRGHRRIAAAGLGVWCGLALGLTLGGLHARARLPLAPPVHAAVVQGSLSDDDDEQAKLEIYERLTADAARGGATLVVWPESAVSFRADTDLQYRAHLQDLARRLAVDLVIGTVSGAPGGGYNNSDALVRPDLGLTAIQAKRQLVPFGEYLPLRFLFGKVPAIAWEMGEDFKPGRTEVVMHARGAAVGALVCFEGVFPKLATSLAAHGANVLVNTTNDSWFGWSAGPAQHLQHTILRAAETGRPLLRAANTGISAIVDRNGQVLGELPLGERGVLTAALVPGTALPPGAAAGGAVAWACAIVAFAALVAAFFVRPPRDGTNDA